MTNLVTEAELSGQANTQYAVRSTISMVLNAPVTWSLLAILAGWWARQRTVAAVAGMAALIVALGTHYGVGSLLGRAGAATWEGNQFWLWATVIGLPLGLIGSIAHSHRWWGLVARAVAPLEAIREGVGSIWQASQVLPAGPGRVAEAVSGGVWLVLGLVAVAWLVWHSPQVRLATVRATATHLAEDPVGR